MSKSIPDCGSGLGLCWPGGRGVLRGDGPRCHLRGQRRAQGGRAAGRRHADPREPPAGAAEPVPQYAGAVYDDLGEATRECQAIFIAVGTPQSETGDADLSYVEAVASEIARSIDYGYKVIVEKSTVPVYTNEWIRRVVERNGVSRARCSTWSRTRSFCARARRCPTSCIRTGSSWARTASGQRRSVERDLCAAD